MRNIIAVVFAVFFGAVAVNAHGLGGHDGHDGGHGGCPKMACEHAKKFLEHNKEGLDALLKKEVTGALKVMQDVAKLKLALLEKVVNLEPPVPLFCKKALKKAKKAAIKAGLGTLLMEEGEEAPANEASATK
jgi:hypothetical protein